MVILKEFRSPILWLTSETSATKAARAAGSALLHRPAACRTLATPACPGSPSLTLGNLPGNCWVLADGLSAVGLGTAREHAVTQGHIQPLSVRGCQEGSREQAVAAAAAKGHATHLNAEHAVTLLYLPSESVPVPHGKCEPIN